jgi:HK97 family phage portal protein
MGVFSGSRREVAEPVHDVERAGFNSFPVGINFAGLANPAISPQAASQSVAVRSSVDLICSIMSELPVHCYSGYGGERREIPTPWNIQDPAGDGYGLADWIYQAGASWLYRGNLYGTETAWQRSGMPAQIVLHHPDDVALVNVDGPTWMLNGRPVTDPATFVHVRANPIPGRPLGMSPIEEHAVTLGTTLAAARFGSQFLQEGTHPHALLVNTESTIDSEQARIVLDRWRAMKSGTREPAVLGKGWEFKPLTITPNESQFLETMRFTEAQCARIFGAGIAEILGYETGGSMTYANVVDRRADALALSIDRWINRVERLLSGLLPKPQNVEIDRDALLRSATLQRYQAHNIALASGFRTINEVRADESYPPVAWGDEPMAIAPTQPTGGTPA